MHTKKGEYTCKAKGIFRKDGLKPLVGDYVELEEISRGDMVGNISVICDRTNALIRPNVANIDQALIIFALKSPEPNFVTLDKMIIQYKAQGIPVVICFNKEDLVSDEYCAEVMNDYSDCGCMLMMTSAICNEGINELAKALRGKTSAVAGPSGAGKSSLINCLSDGKIMETGEISEKLMRGKHTTRHSEVIALEDNTFIMDTPGFSSFELFGVSADNLADYYEEFEGRKACRFMPCSHTHEPDCEVKKAYAEGKISKRRYSNYLLIYEELSKLRRY